MVIIIWDKHVLFPYFLAGRKVCLTLFPFLFLVGSQREGSLGLCNISGTLQFLLAEPKTDRDGVATSQVGIRSITKEGREQGKKFGVEQYEMRTFSRDRDFLENLVYLCVP